MKKRIHFIIITFSLICSIFYFGSIDAFAYESEDNFYPVNVSPAEVIITFENHTIYTHPFTFDSTDNSYSLNNNDIFDIVSMQWSSGADSFTFPVQSEKFDYYLLGVVTAPCVNNELSTFKPTVVYPAYYDVSSGLGGRYNYSDLNVYNVDTFLSKGFGFYEKVDFFNVNNYGITSIVMADDVHLKGNKPAGLTFEFGILAVDKSSSEEASLAQIFSQLQSMESSINSSIGNAASDITGSIDGLKDQDQQQHNEIINGYDGSSADAATNKFNDSAGELESVEADLTNITNTSVTNYSTSAFDSSIITTLGPSLIYVVTWFTNFWNMGGLFTTLLNIGLALFVAFFILRLHGGGK